jgi:hypothetical protein
MNAARTISSSLIGLGIAALLVRCQLLWGPDFNPMFDSAPPMEAGADMAAPDVVDPCGMVDYPGQSTGADPAMPELDVVFALSQVDYGLNGTVHALNLDQRCTCPGKDSCMRGPNQKPACDLEGGADDAMLFLFKYLSASQIATEDRLNELLDAGVSGAVLRVQKWNGTPNDNSITVSVYPAIGIEDDAGNPPAWRIDRAGLKDPMSTDYPALQTASSAWVANGQLVAAFPQATMVFGGAIYEGGVQPPLHIDFTQAFIVASITQSQVKGVLTGRWATDKMLKSIESFPDPQDPNGSLCGDSGTYAIIANIVCGLRDISSTLGTNENAKCDALSGAIGFTAKVARFGSVGDGIEAGQPCGAGWMPTCP